MKFVALFLPLSVFIAAGCPTDSGSDDTELTDTTGSSTGCYDPTGTTDSGTGVNNCGGVGSTRDGSDSEGGDSGGTVDPTTAGEAGSGDPPGGCVMGGMLPDAHFDGTVSGAHSGTYTLDLPMGTASPAGEAVNGGYMSGLGLFFMQALGPGSEWQFGLGTAEPTEVVPGTYATNTTALDISGFGLPTAGEGWVSTGGTITISNVVPHCEGAPGVYIDGSFDFDGYNEENQTSIAAEGSFSGIFVSVG